MATPVQNFEEDNSYSLKEGHEITFVKEPPDMIQLLCSICLHILSDPCLLDCKCGVSFCRICIEPVRARGKPCPLCSSEFSIVLSNPSLDRILKEMYINCPNKQCGCKWTNTLRRLSDHLNTTPTAVDRLSGCECTVIECRLCPHSCKRKEMENHESLQCPERPYTCEYCQSYTATFKDVYTKHWPSCALFNKVCEKGGVSVNSDLDTPFSTVGGAGFDIVRDTTARRCMEEPSDTEIIQTVLKPAATNVPIVSEIPFSTKTPSKEDDNTRPEENETERRDPQSSSVIMTDFSSLKSPGDAWYSPPFHTHERGYHMCLSVQLLRGADSKGEYVSVSTHVLKGEHDKELKWPFRGELTITLVDQVSGRNHPRTIKYNEEVGEECARRVREEGGRSHGVRIYNFIARKSLMPNFLQNDSLQFNVQFKSVSSSISCFK